MSYRSYPEIQERRQVAPDHVEFILHAPDLSRALPGQFAHIVTPGQLRRPISFSRIDPVAETVGILFQIVGVGTAWLAEQSPGTRLDILGPLGHGFVEPDPDRPWCLVGGGVGIPPLYAAVERWQGRMALAPDVILGARRREWVLMPEDFGARGIVPVITTDDGSWGERGTVAGPLDRWLESHEHGQVYACGPTPMLARVARMTRDRAQTYLALEQRMGCGVGACLACVVPAIGPGGFQYRRVCSDGPVFPAEELIFN